MDEENKWLETVIRTDVLPDLSIKKVELEKQYNIIGKWENFMSEIQRVKAVAILNSGDKIPISLIMKCEHENEHMKRFTKDYDLFLREICMYRDVIPKMESLLDTIGNSESRPWARCIGFRLHDRILLEDLTAAGYRVTDKRAQQGLDSSLVVLKALGKLHALSRALLDKNEIPLDVLEYTVWHRDQNYMVQSILNNIPKLASAVKQWGSEWEDAVERLKKVGPFLGQRFFEALHPKPSEFKVLSHGDCWTNNLMFKFSDDNQTPVDVKFVDLQTCFVSTPARDLHYFFTTSIKLEIRQQHFDELLQTYCDSLKHYSSKLGFGETVPDLKEMKEIFRSRAILDLIEAFMLVPVIVGDHHDAPDPMDVIKEETEAVESNKASPSAWSPLNNMSPTAQRILKYAIQRAIEEGLI